MNFIGLLVILFAIRIYRKNEKKIIKFHKEILEDLKVLNNFLQGLSKFLNTLILLPFIGLRKLLNNSKDIPQEESIEYEKVVDIKDYIIKDGKVKKRKTI